jgi:hypothetical protein
VRSRKGTGRDPDSGRARNGNSRLIWETSCSPNKTSRLANQVLAIEHVVTRDMDDGQPLPPLIEDGVAWHVVRRADGRTQWPPNSFGDMDDEIEF